MEKELKDLLISTHGAVKNLEGIVKGNGAEGMVHDIKKNREDISYIKDNMVTSQACANRIAQCLQLRSEHIEQAVKNAMHERSRTGWRVVKEVILPLLAPGGLVAIVVLYLLGKIG